MPFNRVPQNRGASSFPERIINLKKYSLSKISNTVTMLTAIMSKSRSLMIFSVYSNFIGRASAVSGRSQKICYPLCVHVHPITLPSNGHNSELFDCFSSHYKKLFNWAADQPTVLASGNALGLGHFRCLFLVGRNWALFIPKSVSFPLVCIPVDIRIIHFDFGRQIALTEFSHEVASAVIGRLSEPSFNRPTFPWASSAASPCCATLVVPCWFVLMYRMEARNVQEYELQ